MLIVKVNVNMDKFDFTNIALNSFEYFPLKKNKLHPKTLCIGRLTKA